MVIRHSIKELLAKSMVMRPMKCIVGHKGLKDVHQEKRLAWDKKNTRISSMSYAHEEEL